MGRIARRGTPRDHAIAIVARAWLTGAHREPMPTLTIGDFEWDSDKAAKNVAKHGVSFEEAFVAFLDPRAFSAPDREHPERFVLIGRCGQLRLLFVVAAERGSRIRIISARVAAPHEERIYEDDP